jgi:hypothetical protein
MAACAAPAGVREAEVSSASRPSVRRRRSPSTRSVVSCTGENTPATPPSAAWIGLYENVK